MSDSGSATDVRWQHTIHVGLTLAAFQFLEEVLKMFLWRTFGVICLRMSGVVPFKWEPSDVENLPLSRLVSHYRKYSDNEPLARRILMLAPQRNRCAHQAYLLSESERNDVAVLQKETAQLEELQREVDACLRELGAEVSRLEELPPWTGLAQ